MTPESFMARPTARRSTRVTIALTLATLASPMPGMANHHPDPLAIEWRHANPGYYEWLADRVRDEGMPTMVVVPIHVSLNDSLVDATQQPRWRLANKLAMAGGGAIAVVYPDIGEPYRGVFTKIIEGVEARAQAPVISMAIGAGTDAATLRDNLKSRDVRVVIALGRQGMKAADNLGREFGVVVGGVVAVPEEEAKDLAVVSLSPDPALLFERLRGLVPGTRRIHVVYDPRQNGWLIRLARAAARDQGLELVVREASDLRAAVRAYQEILAGANAERDVLWLPQDATTVDENTVLPLVLRETWERRLPVFSSSFGHVRRGVLFSLFPDNVGLGRDLAGSALGFLASGEPPGRGVMPLRNVQTAVNLRTAKHLGLKLSSQQQRGFDLVFTGQ